VIDEWTTTPRARARSATVELQKGKPVDVKLEYFEDVRDAEVRLAWRLPGAKPPFEEAIEAVESAEVTVFVGGLTGDVEGEEMSVSYPGFAGGDRTEIALPATQDRLLRAAQATGKPIVLVLMAGSAVSVEWAQQKVPAILMAFYPGQQGGNALADVLFGDANPSGRLPVTFYKSVGDLPAFDDYAMKGRTYRYFEGEPLYPFGHGLSYTKFLYSDLRLDRATAGAKDPVQVSLVLKNGGGRAGHELVQLYVRKVDARPGMPRKELRGFERVLLKPGEQRRVSFKLIPAEALAHYDDSARSFAVEAGEYEIQVGASSRDIRLTGRLRVPSRP
jgi:beta-glucosidase